MSGKEKRSGRLGRCAAVVLALTLLSIVTTPKVPARDRVPAAPTAAETHRKTAPQAPEFVPAPQEPVPEEPVPEEPAAPVEDEYFADAVFVGDSRTEGFHLYSGLQEGTYLFSVGATVETVLEKATQEMAEGVQTIMDALEGADCAKVYIMLGVNELGWVYTQTFIDQYEKVLDRARADHPEAEIAVQSILPVTKAQDAKRSYVNNSRIAEFNEALRLLTAQKGCIWLDVASAVAGEDGALPAGLSTDGVHLNSAGCRKWLEYLKQNPL